MRNFGLLLFGVTVFGGPIALSDQVWLADILRDVGLSYNTHRYEVTYTCQGTASAVFNYKKYFPGELFRVTGKKYPVDPKDPAKVGHYFGFDIQGGKNNVTNWMILPDGEGQLLIRRPTFGSALISDDSGHPALLAPTGNYRFYTNDGTYLDCEIKTIATAFDWDANDPHQAEMIRVNSVRRFVQSQTWDSSADVECRCEVPWLACFKDYTGLRKWSDGPIDLIDPEGLSSLYNFYTPNRWHVSSINGRVQLRQGQAGDKFTATIEGPSGIYWLISNDSPYGHVRKYMKHLMCSLRG